MFHGPRTLFFQTLTQQLRKGALKMTKIALVWIRLISKLIFYTLFERMDNPNLNPSWQIAIESQKNNIRAMSRDVALLLLCWLSTWFCQLGLTCYRHHFFLVRKLNKTFLKFFFNRYLTKDFYGFVFLKKRFLKSFLHKFL